MGHETRGRNTHCHDERIAFAGKFFLVSFQYFHIYFFFPLSMNSVTSSVFSCLCSAEESCACCSHFDHRYWGDVSLRLPHFCPHRTVGRE